jgi:hypothetical protein
VSPLVSRVAVTAATSCYCRHFLLLPPLLVTAATSCYCRHFFLLPPLLVTAATSCYCRHFFLLPLLLPPPVSDLRRNTMNLIEGFNCQGGQVRSARQVGYVFENCAASGYSTSHCSPIAASRYSTSHSSPIAASRYSTSHCSPTAHLQALVGKHVSWNGRWCEVLQYTESSAPLEPLLHVLAGRSGYMWQ